MRDREIAFGKAVRNAREAEGYSSQPKLAKAARIGARTVAAVELGEEGVGRKSRAAVARKLGWNPDEVEDYIEGRRDALPSRSALTAALGAAVDEAVQRRAELERRLDEAERRIVNASNAELGQMLIEVMSVPTMTKAAIARWLVDALDMRDEWRAAHDDRATGHSA